MFLAFSPSAHAGKQRAKDVEDWPLSAALPPSGVCFSFAWHVKTLLAHLLKSLSAPLTAAMPPSGDLQTRLAMQETVEDRECAQIFAVDGFACPKTQQESTKEARHKL